MDGRLPDSLEVETTQVIHNYTLMDDSCLGLPAQPLHSPQTSCSCCRALSEQGNGYTTPQGYLLCDPCVWDLAENGEFL